jgi:DNA-binding GntR family transcriptional regulator
MSDRSALPADRFAGARSMPVPSLPEVAYVRMRDAILSGKFTAGQSLRQEELAQSIGTSRVPVREALKRLEVEGLVVLRPRRGYVVASLDPDEIEDIFDIRMMLEQRAGYLATLRRTAEDVAEIDRMLAAMDGMVIDGAADVDIFAERNRAFHARLFEASGRPQLCRTMAVLRDNVERYIRVSALVAKSLARVQGEHHRIADAFRRGDADEVGRLCREHCEGTCKRLIERLKREREKRDASC